MPLARALLVVLAGLLAPAGAAMAAPCGNPGQFAVSELESPFMRDFLLQTKADLEGFFRVPIHAFCFDEEDSYAAYYSITREELVLGVDFFYEVANPPGNLNAAVAVMAHEVAHAFQHHHGLLDMLVETNPHRVKCIELHADFLAGAYMGWRSNRYNVEVTNLATFFYNLGDSLTETDGHHGLGAERFLSFQRGFGLGSDDVITVSSMGIAYVSQADCDS